MLVLSRKSEQSVIIGESGHLKNIVKVTVVGISRGNVMLGFEANESVVIHREEVWREVFKHVRGDGPSGDYHRTGTGNGIARV